MKKLRRPCCLLLALLLLPALAGCGRAEKQSRVYYQYFDTVSTVIGFGTEKQFEEACSIVEGVLSDYHALCDIYYDHSGMNNAKTVNDRAGVAPVEVDGRLLDVLAFGQEMYALTGGECNIAFGAVLSLWHTCRTVAREGGEARLPDAEALREAAGHCSIDSLVLDREKGTAYLTDPLSSLDLGAVAKGYATEAAARALEEAGFTGYALSIGGNVRTVGVKADKTPWIGGIQDPVSENAYLFSLRLTDMSLVTSGCYQRYYTVDGVDYHHIISPDTLFPRMDYLSVTILGPDSGIADALSTALFNMDTEEGLALINGMDDTEACWILRDGSFVFSDGFEAYLTE